VLHLPQLQRDIPDYTVLGLFLAPGWPAKNIQKYSKLFKHLQNYSKLVKHMQSGNIKKYSKYSKYAKFFKIIQTSSNLFNNLQKSHLGRCSNSAAGHKGSLF